MNRNSYLHFIDPLVAVYSSLRKQTHYRIPRLRMRTEAELLR